MEKAHLSLKISLRWFLFLLPVLLFLPSVDAGPVTSLTLKQAITMALENNYQVRISRNDLEKAKLTVKQEVAKVYPQAVVDGCFEKNLETGTYPTNYTITITEKYPTKFNWYGQKISTGVEAVLWDQLSCELGLRITEANTVYNTFAQYYNVLKAEKLVQLQELAVKNAQTAAAIAQKQLQQGKITKPTQLKTMSDLTTAQYNLEKNQSDYLIALRQLGNLIGLADLSKVKLAEEAKVSVELPDYAQLQEKVLQNRLETKQAQINIEKAQRVLGQASNQQLPVLSLGYNSIDQAQSFSVNYNFLSGDLSGTAARRDGNFINDNNNLFGRKDQAISLNLTWNLDFGITRAQTQLSQVALDSVKISQKLQDQNLILELDQAFSGYQLAMQKAYTDQQAVPYYQKTLEIKRLEYQLGSATQLDVAIAEQNLLQAQITMISSGYDETVAYHKLKLVSGELYKWDTK